MRNAHRHFRWAPRLVPATFASLVSLFAIAPAETMFNRLLHAPHPVTTPAQDTQQAPGIVMTTHYGPHENPMRLQRFAYKPEPPRGAQTDADCARGACFDPDQFEPAAGGVAGEAAESTGPGVDAAGPLADAPPASPSEEAQFDTAGIGDFTDGGEGNGGGSGNGGGNSGRGGPDALSFALLPGAGGPGVEGGQSGTGDAVGESPPSTGNRGGGGGGTSGPSGGSGGSGGFAGSDSGSGGSGDDDDGLIETTSLRVAPAAGAIEVSAPGTAALLAGALVVLGLRRRAT